MLGDKDEIEFDDLGQLQYMGQVSFNFCSIVMKVHLCSNNCFLLLKIIVHFIIDNYTKQLHLV